MFPQHIRWLSKLKEELKKFEIKTNTHISLLPLLLTDYISAAVQSKE